MAAPVPWSLAWNESGELAFTDRFDLLQSMVLSENPDVQVSLIASIERLSLHEVSNLCSDGLTGLCC
ncbi:hypothetical protein KBY66_00175 [Synechococcus sp. Tobar12-5m-g]|jgi:hypothetical protein|uniref:hypothetical protein n=1 Tax=unclassified Synechococcus TaxID=2626047 RepID=UPI0020CF87EF|nr:MULTISPECIES: hypothetical protein [unclassified Synechococcus]MCP9771051.1 hypothetical protein [Synechococcus sp. Tobar12-5m-g]MCP9871991.1 hypothetical protein [Synechococcus sp. Cruz CV-v-12]